MTVRSSILTLAAAVIAAPLLAAGPAQAADRFGDFYLGLRAVGAYAQLHNQSATGFTGSHEKTNSSDFTAGGGAVAGFRFFRVPLRMEVEGHWTYRFDWDNRDITAATVDYESNVETHAVLFNTILDWRNNSAFTPFVGVSLGWARHRNETTRTVIPTQAKVTQDDVSNNFAYGLMLGVDWALDEDWTIGLAYRFIRMGEVSTGRYTATGDQIDAQQYESHDVLLDVKYTF